MRWLSLIVISALSFGAFASPFDPPVNASASEKTSWTQARCKWRMVDNQQMIGYEMEPHIKSLDDCFLEARLMMMLTASDTEYSEADRARYLKNWDVIWDNHLGHQAICQMVPLKTSYSDLDENLVKAALFGTDRAALARVKQIVENNIALECHTPIM